MTKYQLHKKQWLFLIFDNGTLYVFLNNNYLKTSGTQFHKLISTQAQACFQKQREASRENGTQTELILFLYCVTIYKQNYLFERKNSILKNEKGKIDLRQNSHPIPGKSFRCCNKSSFSMNRPAHLGECIMLCKCRRGGQCFWVQELPEAEPGSPSLYYPNSTPVFGKKRWVNHQKLRKKIET